MNPAINTLTTILQWLGYLAMLIFVVSLLTWAICKIIQHYWTCKAAYVKMVTSNDDMPAMFRAYMEAKQDAHPEHGKQDGVAEKR